MTTYFYYRSCVPGAYYAVVHKRVVMTFRRGRISGEHRIIFCVDNGGLLPDIILLTLCDYTGEPF